PMKKYTLSLLGIFVAGKQSDKNTVEKSDSMSPLAGSRQPRAVDCPMIDDPAPMSSTRPARFTRHRDSESAMTLRNRRASPGIKSRTAKIPLASHSLLLGIATPFRTNADTK